MTLRAGLAGVLLETRLRAEECRRVRWPAAALSWIGLAVAVVLRPSPLLKCSQELYSESPTYAPALSPDGRTLYFASGGENIYTAHRPDRGVAFSNVARLNEVNSTDLDGTPFVTADDLSLYMFSERAGTQGGRDLIFCFTAPR